MSTNYYTAKEGEFNRHIGKSSIGWRFLVNADDMRTRDYSTLKRHLMDGEMVIINEYGDRISGEELCSLMEKKANGRSHLSISWPPYMTPAEQTSDGPVDFTEGEFS